MTFVKQESGSILSTLDKGLFVLELLAATESVDGLTLTDLSVATGINRTTLFRILSTLEFRNFVARDRLTDRYRLGNGVLTLSSRLLRSLDIREVARPLLVDLSSRTRELVFLTVQDQHEIVTVEAFESSEQIGLKSGIGDRRPLYCTASGKAVLAHLGQEEVDRILARGMPPVTPRTITSAVVLHHNLEEVRRRGFASDDEERYEGVRCVAAPIFDAGGRVVAATSLAAPTLRTSWERLEGLGTEIRDVAAEISSRLGFRAAPALADAATEVVGS